MKNLLLLLVCALVFTSCNFTEEITFKEDGSGEFVMNYDLSEVMKIMDDMDEGDDMEEEDGYQDDEGYEDDYEDEEMDSEDEMEPRNERPGMKMDSVMYFREMLVIKADSIATLPQEEQDRLKSFKNVMVKMKMDEDAGLFNFGIGSTFNSIAELPDALEKMNAAKKMNSQDNKQMSQMENSAVSRVSENMFEYVSYNYNGNTFTRIMKDNYKLDSKDAEALDGEINQMGDDSKVMFQAMTYTLVYNFPRPIKSVSNANASLSDDKKTVTLTMSFLDMVKSPGMMNLNVVLEK